MKENLKNKKIDNMELENISGGTCHSSASFDELGMERSGDSPCPQQGNFHPVIVTAGNSCKYWSYAGTISRMETCATCSWERGRKVTMYCIRRSKESDPCKL